MVAATEDGYDLAGRLQDLTHRKANNATIANYGLTYDAADRLTQVTSVDGPTTFNYDVTDQLTCASHATQANESYSYDLNGNRTNAGAQTGGNNELLTDGVYNYTYDDEGNRMSRTQIGTGVITAYVWDYRNRLTQVTEKTGSGVVTRFVSYRYDVNNQRIGKTVDLDGDGPQAATTERYVYDGNQIALVFDGQGNPVQRFLYGTQVDQVLVQENGNGELWWALADYQGSVRDVVDSQGAVLNHIVYDSFGNVQSQTNGAINFRYGYTGRELDAETGLYYYRARYYDAQTGQFIGQDPASFRGGDLNLYGYVANNPINLTDPFGLRPLSRDENEILSLLENQAVAIETSGRRASNDPYPTDLRDLKRKIRREIEAVPDMQQDPRNLKVVLWALRVWANNATYYARGRSIPEDYDSESHAVILGFTPEDDKCNRFVADAYAKGGEVGYGRKGSFPIRYSIRNPGKSNIPSANETAPHGVTFDSLPEIDSPELGDMVVCPGHIGIYLTPDIYISARTQDGPPLTAAPAPISGVQITKYNSNKPRGFRRFDPYNVSDGL